jgi:F0F1-type ATP synthase assembly protein I
VTQDSNKTNTAAVANTVGQVGCLTGIVALVVIALAFGLGWFLDDLLGNEKRFLTVGMLLLSFPVTLFVTVKISLWVAAKAQPPTATQSGSEMSEKKDETLT